MDEETKKEFQHVAEIFTLKLDGLEKVMMIAFKDLQGKIKDTIDNGNETNGSVASLKKWRYITTGGLIVLIFFVGIFGYIYNINNKYLEDKTIANKEHIEKLEAIINLKNI